MPMLISLFSFLISSTVSNTFATTCTTDNDCDLELMCNTESYICTCSKPYFWRDDIRTCVGCAPGWVELETNKCLLFARSHSSDIIWNKAQTTCNALIAQLMLVNSIEEFTVLERKIQSILNGDDASTATLYFHQGAEIQINNQSMESYTWCDQEVNRIPSDCVQIRQNNITNTICLEYVSCFEQSQFICEASPLIQSELETNLAAEEHSNREQNHEESMVRAPPKVTQKPPPKPTAKPTTKPTIKTTKKTINGGINNVADTLTNGINGAGQVLNALGNLQGPGTYPNSNFQGNLGNNFNDQTGLFALASDNDGFNWKPILFYSGLALAGILVVIIIIVIAITLSGKKKTNIANRNSVGSTASGVSYE